MANDDAFPPDVHVVGLAGSLRTPSHTRQAVHIALQGAASMGATTDLIDLGALDLPFCTGTDEIDDAAQGVVSLREQVGAAHGIILGTPEYHSGYSGVLKNALDLMGFDEFQGKMVGLVGVSGGALGATMALSALRDVGRALHAWVVPEQAGVPRAWKVFDDDGTVGDERLGKRLENVGRQVAQFCQLHRSDTAKEFLHRWEAALENPGG